MLRKVIYLLTLCLLLTGCTQNDIASKEDARAGVEAVGGEATGETQAVVDRSTLDMDYQEINHLQLIGDICYYIRYELGEDNKQMAVLYCRKVGGGEEEIIYTYSYNSEENAHFLSYSRCGVDGSRYNLWRPVLGVEENWVLEKLDASGKELFRVELSQEWGERLETEYIQDATVSAGGELCVMTERSNVLIWDNQGQELGMLDGSKAGLSAEPAEIVSMIKTKGVMDAGTAGIFLYESDTEEQTVTFVPVKLRAAALEPSFVVDVSEADEEQRNGSSLLGDEVGVFGGCEGFCYLSTKESMWKCSLKDGNAEGEAGGSAWAKSGSVERLFNWLDSHISVDRTQLVGVGQAEGGLIFLCYDVNLKSVKRMVVESKDVHELADPNVITIGCLDNSPLVENLEALVKDYNAQSEEYTAKIQYYGSGNYQGMDEMTMALLRGEGPDLFNMYGQSAEYYSKKRILEDLTPYLEKNDIQLLETVENALNNDGKIYTLASGFTLRGFIYNKEYLMDGGVSVERCSRMQEDYPEACLMKNSSKYLYLNYMIEGDMASYMDIEAGTCSFDSEEFIGLLEEINGWKESRDTSFLLNLEELYRKQYLMAQTSMNNMKAYLLWKRAYGEFAGFGGYPNQEGEIRYCMELNDHYAMNSASANKEGAWDFLQYLLSDDAQKKRSWFPLTKNAFEAHIREDLGGENVIYRNPHNNVEERNLNPTEEDIQELYDMVNNMYYFDSTPSAIQSIIGQESVNYFNGTISAEKAAENIQNRVTLYLNEM